MNRENTTIRRLLIALFVFGAVGTGAELILLEHTEDIWQWTPIALLAVSVPLAGSLWFRSATWLIRSFRGIMVLFVASAIVEHRPHLTMLPLNEMLSQHLSAAQRDELYTKLFVPINLNTASEDEILLVPGVGSRMAHEFEEYRPYRAIGQFRREMGKYVDDAEVAAYEQFVFVPIDLNSASDEAILSIPGVGNRMLHEFKEYRPYRSIAQFRREIGKYVDDDEVARLERSVYIGR